MLGFITDRNLNEAEEAFPGIGGFYRSLSPKPRTFLDLVSRFQHWCEGAESRSPGATFRLLSAPAVP